MKISKLFHWLYAILMFLPFGLLVFNALASMWSGNVINFDTWTNWILDVFDGGDSLPIGLVIPKTVSNKYS